MLKSGEIDIIGEDIKFSQAKEVGKHPDLEYMITENIALDELRSRLSVKPFDDVEFRKALHHAIPKKEILQVA
jgi:ABC-type transport system substrate-binding protein